MAKHRRTDLTRHPRKPLPNTADVAWFRNSVAAWAEIHGREFPWRQATDSYRVAVTEILLLQTTATAVERVYQAFFGRFRTWADLDRASESEVRDNVGHLGLGDQRVTRLKSLARWAVEHDMELPSARSELEAVPGIGQYVASAVLAICRDEPEPLLDVNMARVLERFFGERELADIRDDPWLQQLARLAGTPVSMDWALLDLAAVVCTARRPKCANCPLWVRCPTGQQEQQTAAVG